MDPSLTASNVSPQDAALYTANINASPYLPCPHTVTIDKRKDRRDIVPTSSTKSFNGEVNFDIPRFGDRLMEVVLYVRVGVPTATGATQVRLCDKFLQNAIKNIYLTYGGQQLELIDMLWREFKTQKYLSDEKKAQIDTFHDDGKSQAQRNTAALGEQEFRLMLPLYFEDIYPHYPILNALYDFLKLKIEWNPVAKIVETDGSSPVLTILEEKLELNILHNIATERNHVVAITKHPAGNMMMVDGQQYEKNILIPAGTTEFEHSMRNLRQPSGELVFFFRDADTVNSATPLLSRDTFDFTDESILPDTMEIATSGVFILRPTSVKKLMARFYNYRNYSSRPNTIISLPFADDPETKNCSSGHLTLGSTGENTVKFTFNSPTAADIRLDILSVFRRFILHQGGDIHVVFRA
jgi:hypothetical protein